MDNVSYAHYDEDRGEMVFTPDYTESDAEYGWAEYQITEKGHMHYVIEATQWYSGRGVFRLEVNQFTREVAVAMAHAAAELAAKSLH